MTLRGLNTLLKLTSMNQNILPEKIQNLSLYNGIEYYFYSSKTHFLYTYGIYILFALYFQ